MSVQPDHVPALPQPPAPTAAAQLLTRILSHRRAAQWGPAFGRDWVKALEDSRTTYILTPLHEVVRTWQMRLDTAPAVEAFTASGLDDEDGVDLDQALGAR
ncbi:hypothetical protein IPZ58_20695 [Streptomyces roseoverticillatus]|uniref:DUF6247 family protein n=1 Tax=Streptomyces roseoverticillatus TaxID=66429 RepID=UPI001F232E0A|nr:DUF6247 family protein [Streptomyces roseoverticillatus]MCF3103991.1 hypothetical protein [Streptomyces roseoverticillatus]